MIKKARVKKNNTKFAVLFVLFVFVIILISAVLKVASVIRQSKFDGNNRFTISVSNNKNLEVISFSPNNHSISTLRIEDGKKDLKLGQFLKIPMDGFIMGDSLKTDKDISGLMNDILFSYNKIKTNLTIIDILRLVFASKTTALNNIEVYSISISWDENRIDKIVEKIFKDEEIEKENQTIEIINTTDIGGLGGRLAKLIANMGGGVIQVSTRNNNPQKESLILYNGKKTFTVDKLNKVLGFKPTISSKQSIADITIIIGEDNKDPLTFLIRIRPIRGGSDLKPRVYHYFAKKMVGF